MTRLLFVGESPPAGSPPDFRPFDCDSGTRLAAVLGLLDRAALLDHVPMVNLFASPCGVKGAPSWADGDARQAADRVAYVDGHSDHTTYRSAIVALGRRVADAFDLPAADGRARWPVPAILAQWRHSLGPLITYAPHPSGASPVLNDPAARLAVRRTLLPELILGCPTLRPWHFRLDDPEVLADLAVALAPSCIAVGAAAALWSHAQHVARTVRTASPLLAKLDAAVAAQTTPGWDHDMHTTMTCLRNTDGPRHLAARWIVGSTLHPNAGDKWLLKLAEAHDDLAATANRDVVRATNMRYLLATAVAP